MSLKIKWQKGHGCCVHPCCHFTPPLEDEKTGWTTDVSGRSPMREKGVAVFTETQSPRTEPRGLVGPHD